MVGSPVLGGGVAFVMGGSFPMDEMVLPTIVHDTRETTVEDHGVRNPR